MKKIAILGSTGSIGTQTLNIVRNNSELKVTALAAGRNIKLLEAQAREFKPDIVAVYDPEGRRELSLRLKDTDIKVLGGMDGLIEAAAFSDAQILVTAVVGMIGIRPTIAAIEEGKDIALANKETLVTAGHIIIPLAGKKGVRLLPVDSEHSAIFQSLQGEPRDAVESIILTASGGPFRGRSTEQLKSVTVKDALMHPNWSMGKKITVDSASMVNKCLEIIEAKHLFGMAPSEIEVVVHPQSIVHSMVRFADGAVLAQLGTPDMRVPIAYALDWPKRDVTGAPRLDFAALTGGLTFEVPDTNVFRTIPLAYESLERGGTATAALNGANEVLVAAFLKEKIRFIDIQNTLLRVMDRYKNTPLDTIENVFEADRTARQLTKEVLSSL